MSRRLKVYIASKFFHGARWRNLGWDEFVFTSRWFSLYHDHVPDEAQFAKLGWMHDIEDVESADVVLVYGGDQADDRLCGALVEAGAGLAFGKTVVVGPNPDFGTWQFHPNVHPVGTLEAARTLLRLMASDWRDGCP